MQERTEILLREYDICQQHNDHIGSQVWVSTTIFLSINVTLLGGILYGILTSDGLSKVYFGVTKTKCLPPQILIACLGITILGAGIIFILCNWQQWLKRMKFRTAANFERMKEIESMLGMRRHTIVRLFDKANEDKRTEQDKGDFENRLEDFKLKYYGASGFSGLIKMAWTLIALWILFIAGAWLIAIVITV